MCVRGGFRVRVLGGRVLWVRVLVVRVLWVRVDVREFILGDPRQEGRKEGRKEGFTLTLCTVSGISGFSLSCESSRFSLRFSIHWISISKKRLCNSVLMTVSSSSSSTVKEAERKEAEEEERKERERKGGRKGERRSRKKREE